MANSSNLWIFKLIRLLHQTNVTLIDVALKKEIVARLITTADEICVSLRINQLPATMLFVLVVIEGSQQTVKTLSPRCDCFQLINSTVTASWIPSDPPTRLEQWNNVLSPTLSETVTVRLQGCHLSLCTNQNYAATALSSSEQYDKTTGYRSELKI